MFCMFKHIATEVVFVAVNCHLYFDAKVDYIRHAQAVYLLERLSAFIANEMANKAIKTKPCVILCGDLNSEPVSSVLSVFHGDTLDLDSWAEGTAASFLNEQQLSYKHFYVETEQLHKQNRSKGAYECIPNDAKFTCCYDYYNPAANPSEPPLSKPCERKRGHPIFT